jgi:hypothetical protein
MVMVVVVAVVVLVMVVDVVVVLIWPVGGRREKLASFILHVAVSAGPESAPRF